MAAVKEAIGPNAALLVDCHSRLSPVMARIVLREVGDDGLQWPSIDENIDSGRRSIRRLWIFPHGWQ